MEMWPAHADSHKCVPFEASTVWNRRKTKPFVLNFTKRSMVQYCNDCTAKDTQHISCWYSMRVCFSCLYHVLSDVVFFYFLVSFSYSFGMIVCSHACLAVPMSISFFFCFSSLPFPCRLIPLVGEILEYCRFFVAVHTFHSMIVIHLALLAGLFAQRSCFVFLSFVVHCSNYIQMMHGVYTAHEDIFLFNFCF